MYPQLLQSLFIIFLAFGLVSLDNQCENAQLKVGFFYNCQVDGASFTNFSGSPVVISAKQKGLAGLPSWLSVVQFNSTSSVFVYGTPTVIDAESLTLEITVMNVNTFKSQVRTTTLTFLPIQGNVIQEHELYIINYGVLEFLQSHVQSLFQSAMEAVYKSVPAASPCIVRVVHPSSRAIAAPLPPNKHGVIVVVTPGVDTRMPSGTFCHSNFTEIFTDHYGFQVESCSVMEYPTTIEGNATMRLVEGRDTPTISGSSITLLIILIVGGAILVVIAGLAFAFFGTRKKGVTVTHKRKSHQSVMYAYSKARSSGPVSAQTHLRDLARPPTRRPSSDLEDREQDRMQSVSEEALLEFHDLTDYNDHEESQQPLPPYIYPNMSYIPSL